MKVTIKGYVCAIKHSFSKEVTYSFRDQPFSTHGFVTVMPYEAEVEIPADFNYAAGEVERLQKAKEALRREFDQRVAQINDEISRLTCLEFNPS